MQVVLSPYPEFGHHLPPPSTPPDYMDATTCVEIVLDYKAAATCVEIVQCSPFLPVHSLQVNKTHFTLLAHFYFIWLHTLSFLNVATLVPNSLFYMIPHIVIP